MNIIATNNVLHNHFYKTPFQNLPTETSTTLEYRNNTDTLTKAKRLMNLEFITNNENILLFGNLGVGKHI